MSPTIVKSVRVDDRLVTFVLTDERELSIPMQWSGRLTSASREERDNYTVTADGWIVEWPDIYEHIGVWIPLGLSEDEFFGTIYAPGA
jgi:hypothetical protein